MILQNRQLAFDAFYSNLDKERVSYGHKEFPERLQKRLDAYDKQIHYLPNETEVTKMLALFKEYEEGNSIAKQIETLSVQAEAFLNQHWKLVYERYIINLDVDSDIITQDEQAISDCFKDLCQLRVDLLKLDHSPGHKNINEARAALQAFENNSYYQQNSLQMALPLNTYRAFVEEKQNEFNTRMTTFAIAGISTIYTFAQDGLQSPGMSFIKAFLTTIGTLGAVRALDNIDWRGSYQSFNRFFHAPVIPAAHGNDPDSTPGDYLQNSITVTNLN